MAAVYLSPLLSMSVKYLWAKTPTGSYYFKRRVPLDLREQVGKEYVQICLHTRDLKVATKKIHELARQTDADWEHLRKPTRGMTIDKAYKVLQEWGIDPNNPQESPALSYFYDSISDVLPDQVREKHDDTEKHEGFDRVTFYEDIAKHVSPEASLALQITQGTLEIRASDCLEIYQKMRPSTPQAEKTNKIPFTYLKEHLGDRDIRKYRRADANSYIRYLLTVKKIKTTTVERYITTLRSAWNVCIREHELEDAKNPWQSLEIPKLGQDSDERQPFTLGDYRKLYEAIGIPQTDLRAILVILAETGARLAEIVGLSFSDCHVGDEEKVPYIHIKEHPWRPLKTPHSVRKVPLTPKALEALRLALEYRKKSPYVFPRYVDGKTSNATTASASLNKYIRSIGLERLTAHSLRHGMRDLLRAVECPDSLARQIQGWADKDVSDGYGAGYSLAATREWVMRATALLMG